MTRPTIKEIKERRLNSMTAEERSEFDAAYEATRLAFGVGEKDSRGSRGGGVESA